MHRTILCVNSGVGYAYKQVCTISLECETGFNPWTLDVERKCCTIWKGFRCTSRINMRNGYINYTFIPGIELVQKHVTICYLLFCFAVFFFSFFSFFFLFFTLIFYFFWFCLSAKHFRPDSSFAAPDLSGLKNHTCIVWFPKATEVKT